MAMQKLTDKELLALGAEVNARWMGTFVERKLVPLVCICARNTDPGDKEAAYEILASKGVDEKMITAIIEKLLVNYKNAEHIVLK
jgi:hypothetical protein